MKKIVKMFVVSLMITFTSFGQIITNTNTGTWNNWVVGAQPGILHTQGTKIFKKNRNDVNTQFYLNKNNLDNYGYVEYTIQPIKNLGSVNVNFNVHVTNTLVTTPSGIPQYVVAVVINGIDTVIQGKAINNTETHIFNFTVPTTVDSVRKIRLIYIPIGNNIQFNTDNLETIEFTNPIIAVGVGVAEYSKNEEKLSIFPNPSNGDVNIKFNATKEKTTIEVFDIQGRLVHENTEEREIGVNTTKLNLEGLSAGIYIVRVQNTTFKITIVK